MGNRACNGVLCYDIDPERSVHEEATNDISVIYNKIVPWRFKRALSNGTTHQTDDSVVVPPSNKRRPLYRGDGKQAVNTGIPFGRATSNSRRKIMDRQQRTTSYSDLSVGTNDNIVGSNVTNPTPPAPLFSPFHHCRTMSSETCGREARTEVNLSRRSSTTTCEREGMYDDILFHRSQSQSDERG